MPFGLTPIFNAPRRSGTATAIDAARRVYRRTGLVSGTPFIVYANGAEVGRATVSGGVGVVTLATAPAADATMSYSVIEYGSVTPTIEVPITLPLPSNTVAPVVTGTAQVGVTLTVSNGTWTNSPTAYAYQWLRDGVAISGSINSTRILQSADLGAQMSATVTATNAGGSTSATSAVTAAVVDAVTPVPVNSVLPVVSGGTTVGSTLTTTNGTWNNSPTAYAYQWRRAGVNIPGATSATYVLTNDDLGTAITSRVTATNAGGDGVIASNAVNVPALVPSTPVLTLSPSGTGITVSWVDGSANGAPITLHRIYRGTVSGSGGRSLIASPAIAAGSAYEDTSVVSGTTYYYVVAAVNSVGQSPLSTEQSLLAGSPATAAAAVLTSASFGSPAPVWTSTTEPQLRRAPTTLVNPIEPGIARDETRPGTGIEPIVPMTSYDKSNANAGDMRQDLLIIGNIHTTGASNPTGDVVRTSAMKISGYRHFRMIGHDLGETQLAINRRGGNDHIEGVRGDLYNAAEGDAIAARGGEVGTSEPATILTMQNVHVRGMHGTNRSHDTGTAITSIAVSSQKIVKVSNVNTSVIDQIVVTLSAAAPGGAPASGRAVILGSTLLDGTKSQPLQGFNDTWYVASSPSSTATTLYLNSAEISENKTFTTSSGSGGMAWVCGTGTGQHADGIQNENIIPYTGVNVTSIAIASLGGNGRANKINVVLSTAATAAPIPGKQVVLKDTYLDGTYSNPGEGFNDTWICAASPAPTTTTFSLITPAAPDARPVSGTGAGTGTYTGSGTAPTGKAYITNTTSEVYAYGAVPNRKFRYAETHLDRVTIYGQYQGYIGGAWGQAFFASRCNFVHSFKRPGLADSAANAYLDPMDSSSGLIYLYTADGQTPTRTFYEVLLSNRANSSLLGGGGMYEGGGYSQSGTVDGAEVVWFRTGYPTWQGVVKRGVVSVDGSGNPQDYAAYASLGNKYTSPGYAGYTLGGTGSLNDINVAFDGPSVSEAIAASGSIGWVDVAHSTVGEIIDVIVSEDTGNNLKLLGSQLVRGRLGLDFESLTPQADPTAPRPYQFKLKATIRGTTQFLEKTFTLWVADDALPASTPAFSYLTNGTTGATATTFAPAGLIDIGPAAADREIIIPVHLRYTSSTTHRNVSSVTLTATNFDGSLISVTDAQGNTTQVASVTYTMPSIKVQQHAYTGSLDVRKVIVDKGDRIAINIVADGSCNHIAYSAYKATGIATAAYDAVSNTTGLNVASTADSMTLSVTGPAGAMLFLAGTFGNSGGLGYHTGYFGSFSTSGAHTVLYQHASVATTATFKIDGSATAVTNAFSATARSTGNNPFIGVACVFVPRG